MYCDKKGRRSTSSCKVVNNCKDFSFNPLDVFDDKLEKTYNPREKKKSKGEQLKFIKE
jgi:hypothetical protein